MAKFSFTALLGGIFTRGSLNTNFEAIETDLNDKVLYRDNPAGSPNSMQSTLDLNSNRLINLPSGTDDSEPATVGQLNSTRLGSNVGVVTISDDAPSGGSDGDIWLEY